MKFFVPCTQRGEDGEGCWFAIRDWLAGIGLETTGRRISALVCHLNGVDHVLAVGRETPYGDMAVAILESDDLDLIYVCTYRHGVFEGVPYAMKLDEAWRVARMLRARNSILLLNSDGKSAQWLWTKRAYDRKQDS